MAPATRAIVAPVTAALASAGSYAAARRALLRLAYRPTPADLAPALLRALDRSYTAGEQAAADG